MNERNIKILFRQILSEEDIVANAENQVNKHIEPLAKMVGIEEDMEYSENDTVHVMRPPFPRIVEILPNNPKKAFMIYKKLHPTLKEEAPTPQEVRRIWNEYSETENIIMYVRRIAKIIYNHFGTTTSENLK